jgi:hypothetical protein
MCPNYGYRGTAQAGCDSLVKRVERKKGPLAQQRADPSFDLLHGIFDFSLVTRFGDSCWNVVVS